MFLVKVFGGGLFVLFFCFLFVFVIIGALQNHAYALAHARINAHKRTSMHVRINTHARTHTHTYTTHTDSRAQIPHTHKERERILKANTRANLCYLLFSSGYVHKIGTYKLRNYEYGLELNYKVAPCSLRRPL